MADILQLFFCGSAHVCRESGFDVEGWEEYVEDWRFFFECMLSPVPKQVFDAFFLQISILSLQISYISLFFWLLPVLEQR